MQHYSSVGGVAAEGLGARADRVALSIENNMAASRTAILDVPVRRAGHLVGDKEKVGARVAEHGLEVVGDAPAAAPVVAGGDDDRRARAARDAVDGAPVAGVVVDGGELLEGRWVASAGQLATGFAVPVLAQMRVAGTVSCAHAIDPVSRRQLE